MDDAERVHAETVEAWHAWLAEHHDQTDGRLARVVEARTPAGRG